MTLDLTVEFPFDAWDPVADTAIRAAAIDALERGGVLHLPRLGFEVRPEERRFLSEEWLNGRSKSIYLRGAARRLHGARGSRDDRAGLGGLLERFARQAQQLVSALFPPYCAALRSGNTSLRPREIAGRPTSWRHDDTRLHTDAFPSSPTGGARILRVFTNVDPSGAPRVWQVGEPFSDMAARFLPRARRQLPGEAWLLRALMITKRRRTEYDHLMRELHDRVKFDMDYQRNAPRQRIEFLPGSTWIVFSDQVLHSVLSGRMMLEQTWLLPVAGSHDPQTAPLRVLERLTGRALA
ncbi:MAG TPA: Kdo hydroxylase family protein [Burkholderiales bacterium]|nr:Kdo hydroxylase family protein [Burkholderiales bacterium]